MPLTGLLNVTALAVWPSYGLLPDASTAVRVTTIAPPASYESLSRASVTVFTAPPTVTVIGLDVTYVVPERRVAYVIVEVLPEAAAADPVTLTL